MKRIIIRATLRLASIDDIYTGKVTYHGKVLFLKCPFSGKFDGIYRIPILEDVSMQHHLPSKIKEMVRSSSAYSKKEILIGLYQKQFYTFSDGHNSLDYQFKLALQKAEIFDFFESDRVIMPNIYYYQKINDHEVTGPFITNASSEILTFKNNIEKGNLYVISSTQSFNQITKSIAS